MALDRFKEAQSAANDGFASAMAELRSCGKRGHWIWHIFPQLVGLGRSPTSELYGISDIPEAEAYVRDPELRERLLAAATAVIECLRAGRSLLVVMGAPVDVLKLVSSLTLFGAVARHLQPNAPSDDLARLTTIASEILAQAESEGYARCAYTLRVLDNHYAR